MSVDFAYVPHSQLDIHDRLINWAKWARGSSFRNVHPMFRQYRNDYWEAAPTPSPADTIDALAIQKTMKDIPEKHRMAVQWFYIVRSNPQRMCRELGVTKAALAELVIDGRAMVRNRLRANEPQTA